jgi:hypothetical protein
MDAKTLITIVVTAVVTAMARRLVEAIEGWLKSRNITGTVMEMAKKLFTIERMAPFIDMAGAISLIFAIERRFGDGAPLTGRDVGDIIALSSFMSIFLGSLMFRIYLKYDKREKPPET